MRDDEKAQRGLAVGAVFGPAAPLWQLVPTRDGDGRCLADFMMLIPRLGSRPDAVREQVAQAIREVCESYGTRVVFADINHALGVLWVSVAAEPGLAGRVAWSIRGRVPEALLVGGQLGAVALPTVSPGPGGVWRRLRGLPLRALRRLGGPAD